MRQSLNELYSTARKAAVGRGAPHGIAEDLADAVCWLSSLKFDGVACAVGCLSNWQANTSSVQLLRKETGLVLETEKASTAASVLLVGPALGDLLQAGAVPDSGLSISVDVPLLAVAVVAQTCARLKRRAWLRIYLEGQAMITDCNQGNCEMIVETQQSSVAVLRANEVTLWSNQPDQSSGTTDSLITQEEFIRRCGNALTEGLEVCEDSLMQLELWAALTLVPETEHSLETGAGAGLLDND